MKFSKLLLNNLIEKPFRLIATTIAIALAVAVIFTAVSFRKIVYDYFIDVRTLDSGETEILITNDVNAGTIIQIDPELKGLDGVEYAVGSFSIYGNIGGEYIGVKGFKPEEISILRTINYVEGGFSAVRMRDNHAVVSKTFAKTHDLKIGQYFDVEIYGKTVTFELGGIAENTGYFEPNRGREVIVTTAKQAIGAIFPLPTNDNYNEIYVKLRDGHDKNTVINQIKEIYKDTPYIVNVGQTINHEEIGQDSYLYAAAIIVVGLAAVFLSIAIIVFLYSVTFRERSGYISKMKSVGASNKQLAGLFVGENLIISAVAAGLGLALAQLILRILLTGIFGRSMRMELPWFNYLGSYFAGVVVAVCCSLIPLRRAISHTIKETQISGRVTTSKPKYKLAAILAGVLIVLILLESFINPLKPYIAFVSFLLLLLFAGLMAPIVLSFVGWLLQKSKNTVAIMAGRLMQRDKSTSLKAQILTVGMLVCIIFMSASNLTQMFFTGYLDDISSVVLLKNISVGEQKVISDIAAMPEVKNGGVYPLFWESATVVHGDMEKTMNLMGINGDMVDDLMSIDFITNKTDVQNVLNDEDAPYVIFDYSFNVAYGLEIDDEITLRYYDTEVTLICKGFTHSQFYVGRYVLVNNKMLAKKLDIPYFDTLWINPSGTATELQSALREKYAASKYFIASIGEVETMGTASLPRLFKFISWVCYIVGVMSILGVVMNIIMTRIEQQRERSQLLSIGMGKKRMFLMELLIYGMTALVSLVVAYLLSLVVMYTLFHAVIAFGLYYVYQFDFVTSIAVGIVLFAVMSLMPIILMFPKRYNINIEHLKVLS